jgi:hypothetical protein
VRALAVSFSPVRVLRTQVQRSCVLNRELHGDARLHVKAMQPHDSRSRAAVIPRAASVRSCAVQTLTWQLLMVTVAGAMRARARRMRSVRFGSRSRPRCAVASATRHSATQVLYCLPATIAAGMMQQTTWTVG